MVNKVRQYITENNLLIEKDSVILGVSGGADSVCLLSVLHELRGCMALKLTVVHVNHGLRGGEAAGDYLFVERLCEELDVKFLGFSYDVAKIASREKISTEEAGRKIRYETFYKVLRDENAGKIAVAHNINDNAETILLSLFRGTGLKGLTGIRPIRERVIRPLLCVTRGEIEEYLGCRNIPYRTDRTNFEPIYSRNKIRLNILPEVIRSINSQAVHHIINAGSQLNEIEQYLESETRKQYDVLVTGRNKGRELPVEQLDKLDIVIKKRVIRMAIDDLSGKLKNISSVHVDKVLELGEKEVGKKISLPYGLTAFRTYDSIMIRPQGHPADNGGAYAIKITGEGKYLLPSNAGSVDIIIKNRFELKKNEKELYTKWFDYDKIKGDLFLRTRLEGDFLTINSSNQKKKLKSFFIDCKIPREKRINLPLLAEGAHILWVIGYRASEAYKVTEETARILEVHFDGGCNAKDR